MAHILHYDLIIINKLGGLEILPYMAVSYISHFLSTWVYDMNKWYCAAADKKGKVWKEKCLYLIPAQTTLTQTHLARAQQTDYWGSRCRRSAFECPALNTNFMFLLSFTCNRFLFIDHSRLPLTACDVTNYSHAAVKAELQRSNHTSIESNHPDIL